MTGVKDLLWGFFLRILKRWSRAGLNEISEEAFRVGPQNPRVLSIGGFGPIDTHFRELVAKREGRYLTLDIDAAHSPDMVADVMEIVGELSAKKFTPDFILALEVFEHVERIEEALSQCHACLSKNGVLIASLPWIIPIHDRPYDYRRLTPIGLTHVFKDFSSVQIVARGNYYDSVVMILLRGLFSGGKTGKILMLIGSVLSLISRVPRTYINLEKIDSTIGYVVIARK
jgi:hypothetical protein